jgi:hypothetical protein
MDGREEGYQQVSRRGVDENDGRTGPTTIGRDVGMIVTASLSRSFADMPYKEKMLLNGSS